MSRDGGKSGGCKNTITQVNRRNTIEPDSALLERLGNLIHKVEIALKGLAAAAGIADEDTGAP